MNRIQTLIQKFTDELLDAIRESNINELLSNGSVVVEVAPERWAPSAKVASKAREVAVKVSTGRLTRRSPEEIAEVVDKIAGLLKKHPDGLRSEQIQKTLGLDKREVPRVLRDGVASKSLSKKGQKRATVYFAGKGGKSTSGSTKTKTAKAPRKAPRKAKVTSKKASKARKPAKSRPAKRSAAKRTLAKKAPAKKAPKASKASKASKANSAPPVTTDKAAE